MKSVRLRILSSLAMNFYLMTLILSFLSSCGSKILKYEQVDQLKTNIEFDQAVKIDTLKEAPKENTQKESKQETNETHKEATKEPSKRPSAYKEKQKKSQILLNKKSSKNEFQSLKSQSNQNPTKNQNQSTSQSADKNAISSIDLTKKDLSPVTSATTKGSMIKGGFDGSHPPAIHLPDIEDGSNFNGRRPLVDPFQVGEIVVHDVSYYKVSAGEFEMKVGPYKLVNGQKSYSFLFNLKSSSLFSKFYSVDDNVETLVDYNEFVPRTYSLHVKESGQLREARSLFNHESLSATFWEKKYTEKSGNEEKKLDWQILPYSQNVFSALFYMRNFKWDVGKDFFFRIAHDQENILFKAKALRKEKLETKIGTFNAVVIKPEVSVKGIFKPMGDIYFWLSDDDRRYILRIELSIKIGTITSEVIKLIPGS